MHELPAAVAVTSAGPLDVRRVPADRRLAPTTAGARGLFWQRLQFALAAAIALALIAVALFPGVFAPHDPAAISLSSTLKPPSSAHWFGTDQLGRDLLSRVIWGSRVSLFVGFSKQKPAYQIHL